MDPVVVVGAGPVGQTTALLLAKWGVPSVVLDRRPGRDVVGSRAICQQRDVLDVWASVGAGEQIAAEGVTWTTARTFHGDRELFAQTFADAGRSPFPPFVNLSQARTEEILDERIAAVPLVDLRWDTEVLDVTADGMVRLASGSITAPFVVLCSGSGGGLRDRLGVAFEGRSFDDRFLICDIRVDLPGWATERRFFFDPVWNPGRQVLIHPCPDSTFRIDWQVPPDADLSPQAIDARIRAIVGDRPYELVWTSVYRFHSRCADRFRVGRVLLAGDAAHLVSPFGARGLNSGVADAENAAWKIAHVGRGWAGEELLESYHAERHAAARENIAVTTATMDFLVPPDAARAARRTDVLSRAAQDPSARSEVDSGRLAEPFWYADSPLTTTDPTRPVAARPPRGHLPPPGPGVLLPDVSVRLRRPCAETSAGALMSAHDPVRLRQVARAGVLVLALPGAGLAAAHRAADAVDAPVQVLGTADLDPDGELVAVLGARPGEVWVVRPDAHVAAVLTRPDAEALATALRRALGGAAGRDGVPHHAVPGDDRRPPHDSAPAGAVPHDPQRSPSVTADRGGA